MNNSLQTKAPIHAPARESRTYDKLWIVGLNCNFADPNSDGSATIELHPYCELPDGSKELAPRNPRSPVRRVKHIQGILAKLRSDSKVSSALDTLLGFLRDELEAE